MGLAGGFQVVFGSLLALRWKKDGDSKAEGGSCRIRRRAGERGDLLIQGDDG